MEQIPVNSIDNNSNTIRVNDTNTPIKLTFKYVDGSNINLKDKIDYFYLTKDDEKYYSVTDINFEGDELIFKLPNLIKGLYRLEIRDIEGSIYPADDSLFILLKRSFEEGKESYYTSYREDILNNVEPMVIEHLQNNTDKFKGVKGDKGEKGDKGDKGYRGDRGYQGDKGDQGIQGIKGDKGDKGDKGADGVITPEQYALINNKISKGNVSVQDINKNLGKFDSTYFSESFLKDLNDGEINATVLLDDSVTIQKLDPVTRELVVSLNSVMTENDEEWVI